MSTRTSRSARQVPAAMFDSVAIDTARMDMAPDRPTRWRCAVRTLATGTAVVGAGVAIALLGPATGSQAHAEGVDSPGSFNFGGFSNDSSSSSDSGSSFGDSFGGSSSSSSSSDSGGFSLDDLRDSTPDEAPEPEPDPEPVTFDEPEPEPEQAPEPEQEQSRPLPDTFEPQDDQEQVAQTPEPEPAPQPEPAPEQDAAPEEEAAPEPEQEQAPEPESVPEPERTESVEQPEPPSDEDTATDDTSVEDTGSEQTDQNTVSANPEQDPKRGTLTTEVPVGDGTATVEVGIDTGAQEGTLSGSIEQPVPGTDATLGYQVTGTAGNGPEGATVTPSDAATLTVPVDDATVELRTTDVAVGDNPSTSLTVGGPVGDGGTARAGYVLEPSGDDYVRVGINDAPIGDGVTLDAGAAVPVQGESRPSANAGLTVDVGERSRVGATASTQDGGTFGVQFQRNAAPRAATPDINTQIDDAVTDLQQRRGSSDDADLRSGAADTTGIVEAARAEGTTLLAGPVGDGSPQGLGEITQAGAEQLTTGAGDLTVGDNSDPITLGPIDYTRYGLNPDGAGPSDELQRALDAQALPTTDDGGLLVNPEVADLPQEPTPTPPVRATNPGGAADEAGFSVTAGGDGEPQATANLNVTADRPDELDTVATDRGSGAASLGGQIILPFDSTENAPRITVSGSSALTNTALTNTADGATVGTPTGSIDLNTPLGQDTDLNVGYGLDSGDTTGGITTVLGDTDDGEFTAGVTVPGDGTPGNVRIGATDVPLGDGPNSSSFTGRATIPTGGATEPVLEGRVLFPTGADSALGFGATSDGNLTLTYDDKAGTVRTAPSMAAEQQLRDERLLLQFRRAVDATERRQELVPADLGTQYQPQSRTQEATSDGATLVAGALGDGSPTGLIAQQPPRDIADPQSETTYPVIQDYYDRLYGTGPYAYPGPLNTGDYYGGDTDRQRMADGFEEYFDEQRRIREEMRPGLEQGPESLRIDKLDLPQPFSLPEGTVDRFLEEQFDDSLPVDSALFDGSVEVGSNAPGKLPFGLTPDSSLQRFLDLRNWEWDENWKLRSVPAGFELDGTDKPYIALGPPTNVALTGAQKMSRGMPFAPAMIAATPNVPRVVATDLMVRGLDPKKTGVRYLEGDTANAVAGTALRTGVVAGMDEFGRFASRSLVHQRTANQRYWAERAGRVRPVAPVERVDFNSTLKRPTIAAIPLALDATNGLSNMALDRLNLRPQPTDTNNNRYWTQLVTKMGSASAGVGGPVCAENLLSGKDWKSCIAGFAVPAVQVATGELMYGEPPPNPDTPVYVTAQKAASQVTAANQGLQDLRTGDPSVDGVGDNAARTTLNAAEGLLAPPAQYLTELMNPLRPLRDIYKGMRSFGSDEPYVAPPLVAPETARASAAAMTRARAANQSMLTTQPTSRAGGAISRTANTLDSLRNAAIGGAHMLATPADLFGDPVAGEPTQYERALDRFGDAEASLQRARGIFPSDGSALPRETGECTRGMRCWGNLGNGTEIGSIVGPCDDPSMSCWNNLGNDNRVGSLEVGPCDDPSMSCWGKGVGTGIPSALSQYDPALLGPAVTNSAVYRDNGYNRPVTGSPAASSPAPFSYTAGDAVRNTIDTVVPEPVRTWAGNRVQDVRNAVGATSDWLRGQWNRFSR